MTADEYTVDSTAAIDSQSTADHAYFWTDHRGRKYVGGDDGEIVPLHKLVAYAEHGESALKADHLHHALAADDPSGETIYVDIPEFVIPLDEEEHRRLHDDETWVDRDGIPLLLPSTGDAPSTAGDESTDAANVVND